MEGSTLQDPPPINTFTHAIDAFSADHPFWDPFHACVMLCIRLPSHAHVIQLASIYFRNGCWSSSPILPSEIDELITQAYASPQLLPKCSAHQLAVLYGVFALAALVDLDLPRYNAQALHFFDLARAALAVVSVFDYPETATVQALALASLFLSHGGPRFSMEGAWNMISMASHVCQKVRLSLTFELGLRMGTGNSRLITVPSRAPASH
ncbi:hypothetical protein FB45DRAFT_75479 [Roridomyces roridus]|uniref:Transcription factor domain-containing protein n=1 Tax=Roridomyces roridus TaxID=1738132 RepID=A0AAD7BNM4_9AGAR|nr:hypothetical protein FB45DRAFT_75479 [Roridomyces roridus]